MWGWGGGMGTPDPHSSEHNLVIKGTPHAGLQGLRGWRENPQSPCVGGGGLTGPLPPPTTMLREMGTPPPHACATDRDETPPPSMGPPHACATDGDGPVGPPPICPPLTSSAPAPPPAASPPAPAPPAASRGTPPARDSAHNGTPTLRPPPLHIPIRPPSHPKAQRGGARIGGERGGISGARAGGGAQKGSRPPPSRCAGRVPPWAAHCAGGVTRIGPPTPPPRFASCSVRRGNASKIPTAAGWDGPFRPIGRGALWGGCQTRGGRKGRRGGGDPPNTSREERGGNLPS